MTMMRSGNSVLPECIAVVFSNSQDANFTPWHFFTRQNALWLLQNIHDAKFRVVTFAIATTCSGCFFSLIERFPSLSITYTQQDSFNPVSINPDFWALVDSSPKT
jgi:hypothetical protein